jgi:DNA-binding transcriptional LysR family regulator
MDRLDAMRTFVAVAERGSFAEAARQLRLSPAAATRAVAQVEAELGLQLLARTTRSVRLTERGLLYFERCQKILADVDDARSLARGDAAVPRGLLSVSAPVVFGRLHVLPVVEAALKAFPKLTVRLTLADRLVHLVEERIDVAVRIGHLADSALTAVKVGEVRQVLVASPDYLEARGTPGHLQALQDHDLILFEGLSTTDEWRFGGGEGASVRVSPRLAVSGADAAVLAAERGLGIARALSYQVQEGLAAGRLSLVLTEHAPPPIPVSLVYPTRRIGSPNLRAFVDIAMAELRARLGRS